MAGKGTGLEEPVTENEEQSPEDLQALLRRKKALLGHLTRSQQEAETLMLSYRNESKVAALIDKSEEQYQKLVDCEELCIAACRSEEEKNKLIMAIESNRRNQEEFIARINEWIHRSREDAKSNASSIKSNTSSKLCDARIRKAKAELKLKLLKQEQQMRIEEETLQQKRRMEEEMLQQKRRMEEEMLRQKREELAMRAVLEEAAVEEEILERECAGDDVLKILHTAGPGTQKAVLPVVAVDDAQSAVPVDKSHDSMQSAVPATQQNCAASSCFATLPHRAEA